MSIYIRFENNEQVETTTLENKPGVGWYEPPADFDWQKSYCLNEGGTIAERSAKNIRLELLQNAKSAAFDSIRVYFNNYANRYAGQSHQKAKSYDVQAKAAENILAAQKSELQFDEKYSALIEPLAQVRSIPAIDMPKIIQSKAQNAAKAIAKCEELEDSAKSRIMQAKSQEELQNFLSNFEQKNKIL